MMTIHRSRPRTTQTIQPLPPSPTPDTSTVEPGRASKAKRTRASAASRLDEVNVRGTFASKPARCEGQQTTHRSTQKSLDAKGAKDICVEDRGGKSNYFKILSEDLDRISTALKATV